MREERPDQEWIRLLKQNDQLTTHDLFEWLFTWGITLARRYHHDDDVGHEAALQAYHRIRTRGIYQYQFQCPFLGYCRVILVREVLRVIKKQPPASDELKEEIIGNSDVQLPNKPEKVPPPLQGCLDQLNSREREVIDLLYFKELDPQAAATQLDISRNHVNVIAYRSRSRLKSCLEGQGYRASEDFGL